MDSDSACSIKTAIELNHLQTGAEATRKDWRTGNMRYRGQLAAIF